MKNDLINIGENIKKFRLRAKLTQQELANKVGVTHYWICRLERGKQNNTSVNLLILISQELHINLGDLITN